MGAFESGQTFMAGVLAKLPAEQRAQAEAVFNNAEAKEAVTLIGDSVLARSDYSRNMDASGEKETALTDYYTRLDGWYKDNQDALAASRARGRPIRTRIPIRIPTRTRRPMVSPAAISRLLRSRRRRCGASPTTRSTRRAATTSRSPPSSPRRDRGIRTSSVSRST